MSEDSEAGPTAEALLKALLRVALEEQRSRNEELTVGDQILMLRDCGLAQGQAARVLGIPSNQIPSYMRNISNKKLLAKLSKKKGATTTKDENLG